MGVKPFAALAGLVLFDSETWPEIEKTQGYCFSNLRSKIKAQCRPAEPGLAVRIIGLAVENLCVESCPGEMEEGLVFGIKVSKMAQFLWSPHGGEAERSMPQPKVAFGSINQTP